jgi:hypothetical protein
LRLYHEHRIARQSWGNMIRKSSWRLESLHLAWFNTITKDKMTKENEKRVMVQSWSIFTVMCKQTRNSMVPKSHFSAQLIRLNLSIDLAST